MAETNPAPRRRPPPRAVTVESVRALTPRVIAVTFTGDELEGFGPPKPGGHMKILFAPPGWKAPAPGSEGDAPRPPSRTYTPRRWDPANRRLDVEFVLHGEGLASGWVQTARPGMPLHLAGPGGGYDIPKDAKHVVLLADDTAMPAAATILEALPAGCEATVVCAVVDEKEERAFTDAKFPVRWLHAGRDPATPGTLLERAAAEIDPPGAYWWVACEAGAMRRIRKHLLAERRIEPARVHTRGYWKLGETNYPDHDYGND